MLLSSTKIYCQCHQNKNVFYELHARIPFFAFEMLISQQLLLFFVRSIYCYIVSHCNLFNERKIIIYEPWRQILLFERKKTTIL